MAADNLKVLTTSIVASYVESNKIAAADLTSLIQSTYTALREADHPPTVEPAAAIKLTAAQVRKSIMPEALISFIDGNPYRMLKRHLTTHGLTPKSYQKQYGLPSNYPMTAPAYSAARSALALKAGFGRKAAPPQNATPSPSNGLGALLRPAERAGPGASVPKSK